VARKCLSILFAVVLFCQVRGAWAGEPMAQLSATIDEFVMILIKTPVAQLQATGLPDKAMKLVFERFDFSEMTQLSLGSNWKDLNSGEQKEFVDAFTQRVLRNYGRNVRSTGNEKIVYGREVQDGKQASVETKVVSGNGDELPIDYRLHNINGQWRVYDVAIDSVSVVKNFREQFQRVIARSSVHELLKQIKKEVS
jgi:phospholipid transport system substrate-binding protein